MGVAKRATGHQTYHFMYGAEKNLLREKQRGLVIKPAWHGFRRSANPDLR